VFWSQIDRLDLSGDDRRARVIDYKTGGLNKKMADVVVKGGTELPARTQHLFSAASNAALSLASRLLNSPDMVRPPLSRSPPHSVGRPFSAPGSTVLIVQAPPTPGAGLFSKLQIDHFVMAITSAKATLAYRFPQMA
jgi:hypothetical protein